MNAKVLMAASGKGGTGKSTTCVMLGARLAAHKNRVLLVELDSGLRSVDIIAGVSGRTVYDIEDVLAGRCRADRAVVESPLYPGLWVMSAPYSGGHIHTGALKKLVEGLRDHFDFILLDTAAGMGEPLQAAAGVAELALLVLTADPVALRDGRIVNDWLYGKNRMPSRLVLNRVDPVRQLKGPVKDLDECIDTVAAQLIAVLPESADVQRAAAAGSMLPGGCEAYFAYDNLACRLMGQDVPLLIR